jgi:hypothetical protein
MRVVLYLLIREPGYSRGWVLAQFKRLFPDYQNYHVAPISDGAIWARAYATIRRDYEFTHPGFAAALCEYEAEAKKIIAAGVPVAPDQLVIGAAKITPVPAAQVPSPVMLPPIIKPVVVPLPVPVPQMVGFETAPPVNSNAPTVTALLGHLPNGDEVRWNPAALPNFGISLSGDSGQGKTQTLRAIIADVVAAGLPVTVVDLKDNGTAAALGIAEHDVYRDGLGFNPLALIGDDRGEVQPIQQAVELARMFKRGCRLGDQQEADMKNAIAAAYSRAGIDPRVRQPVAGLPAPPTFADVVPNLDTPVLNRIGALLDLELFGEGGFENLINGQIVLDQHRLPEGIKEVVLELVIMRLHSLVMKGDQPCRLTRLLAIDEAHRVANCERLEGLGREGRSFGIGLILASQYPNDIGPDIAACLDTRIMLRNQQAVHRREVVKAVVGTTRGYTAERALAEAGRLQRHQALVINSEISPYRQVNLLPHFRRGLPVAAE